MDRIQNDGWITWTADPEKSQMEKFLLFADYNDILVGFCFSIFFGVTIEL